jgi:cyanoexosortase A
MYIKKLVNHDRLWLFSSLIGLAVLYLGLVWRTTADIDRLTTDCFFWGIILWLLWQKKSKLEYYSDPISSFIGFLLLGLVLFKTLTLFEFESIFLFFFPFISAIALALIASGFKGLGQYIKELFFAWFLFFPTGTIGYIIDGIFHITVVNAKIATYLLYYFGFDTKSHGNEVILNLSELGNFKAVVGLSCTGVPMILLIFKLSLILICCASLTKYQQKALPVYSIIFGFLLGVIRVCILTLSIPNRAQFDYWHGTQGSQIFSTLAIVIFSAFCYGILEKNQQSVIRN